MLSFFFQLMQLINTGSYYRILVCTYLNGDIRWWRFCSNVEHKQSNSKAHQNSPPHLQPNPCTRIRVPVREVPLPPSFSLSIIILKKWPFSSTLIFISPIVTVTVDNNKTVYVAIFSDGNMTSIIRNFLMMREGVTRATRGSITTEGKAWTFVLFMSRV